MTSQGPQSCPICANPFQGTPCRIRGTAECEVRQRRASSKTVLCSRDRSVLSDIRNGSVRTDEGVGEAGVLEKRRHRVLAVVVQVDEDPLFGGVTC